MTQSYIGLELTGFQGQSITILSYFEKFNMYQATEVSANGITTSPLFSEDDINELIAAQTKIADSIQSTNEAAEAKRLEELEIEESERIGDFLIDNPKQHARAKKTLNTVIRYGKNDYKTRKEFVHSLFGTDFKPAMDKGKYLFVNENTGEFYFVTKTEVDYYNFLLTQQLEVSEVTAEENQQEVIEEGFKGEDKTISSREVCKRMKKSYSFKELAEIGRREFNLSDDWYCFSAVVTENGPGNKLKYGLSQQDKNSNWKDEEVYGFVSLYE